MQACLQNVALSRAEHRLQLLGGSVLKGEIEVKPLGGQLVPLLPRQRQLHPQLCPLLIQAGHDPQQEASTCRLVLTLPKPC